MNIDALSPSGRFAVGSVGVNNALLFSLDASGRPLNYCVHPPFSDSAVSSSHYAVNDRGTSLQSVVTPSGETRHLVRYRDGRTIDLHQQIPGLVIAEDTSLQIYGTDKVMGNGSVDGRPGAFVVSCK